MRSTLTAIALAALLGEAVASPTHLRHRHFHEKKDVDWSKIDWASLDIDWASAYSAGIAKEQATATPTAVSSVAAASATTTAVASPVVHDVASEVSSVAASVESTVASLWNDLVGIANDITAFGEEVAGSGAMGDGYSGNYGSPYGHNMMKVDSAEGYQYTNEFVNTANEAITVVIWNKVGPDLQVNSGSALAPKKPTLTFALAPGESQIVAFQENSQVGWAQACDDVAASGAFAISWGEAQYRSDGSGYDLSAIMNKNGNNYNMSLSSKEVTCVSDMTQNYWLTATQPIGNSDGSCYVPQSSCTMTTHMGGTV